MNNRQIVKLTKSDVLNKDNLVIPTSGKNFLTESGVYKLIFKSRKKEAEKFADWVTDEVLSTIRKTGKYEFQNNEFQNTNKTNQNTNKTEYKLSHLIVSKKTYNSNPVLLTYDIANIFGIQRKFVYKYNKQFNIYARKLNKRETIDFYNENNMDFNDKIRGILVFSYEDVVKFANALNRVDLVSFLYDYFYSNIESVKEYNIPTQYITKGELQYYKQLEKIARKR